MNLSLQASIYNVQEAMLQLPQVECEVFHHFADGVYARELHIPAGVCLTGALHLTNHFFSVSKGECYSVTHEGREHHVAPYLGQTYPNTKRVIYAVTDTVWTTFHPTNETDVDKIAAEILGDSECLSQ